MKENYIQTLHPIDGKTNKKISMEKYEAIRATLLHVLSYMQPSHTELMEEMYALLKDTFEGNVQWYGETVKLDLEARGIIGRTPTKPQKYLLLSLKK
jgi:hypothetical protein